MNSTSATVGILSIAILNNIIAVLNQPRSIPRGLRDLMAGFVKC